MLIKNQQLVNSKYICIIIVVLIVYYYNGTFLLIEYKKVGNLPNFNLILNKVMVSKTF